MSTNQESNEYLETQYQEPIEQVGYDFGLSRRDFVKVLGAGLLITVSAGTALGQRRGGRDSGRSINISARIHIANDGKITVMTGKVDGGQVPARN